MAFFGGYTRKVITGGTEEEIKVNSYSLRVVPYWKWMPDHFDFASGGQGA